MALLTALKFDPFSGGICMDSESWHLRKRKTWFSDRIYHFSIPDSNGSWKIKLLYAGIGQPSFHYEVASEASRAFSGKSRQSAGTGGELKTVRDAAEIILKSFNMARRRRIDDKLRFLYNLDTEELVSSTPGKGNKRNKSVMERSMALITGEKKLNPGFLNDNEACIIGVDRKEGFEAYALKESDCVLSFQSCGFEALGRGRYAAAMSLSTMLGNMFLDSRRKGIGRRSGTLSLMKAMLEAFDHFGQAGGMISLGIIDARDEESSRNRDMFISGGEGLICLEIARLEQSGLLNTSTALDLLENIISGEFDLDTTETKMFKAVKDFTAAEKLLRGYKTGESWLPIALSREDFEL